MSQDTEEKLSPEQYAVKKAEILKFYQEELPFLLKKKEYETVLTELDELQMRRVFAQVKIANLIAEPPVNETDNKTRPLKKA